MKEEIFGDNQAPDDDGSIVNNLEEVRKRIIGLGDDSFKKSYYPILQYRQDELKRFRIALDGTNDLVFILNYPSLNITDSNCRAEDVLEYSKKELKEMNIHDLISGESEQLHENISLLEKGSFGLIRADLKTKYGRIIHMELSMSLAGFGKDTYAAAVCRDITERESLERAVRESELQYRTTINTLKDIIVVIDSSLDFVIFNNAFEKLCTKINPGGAEKVKNLKNILSYFNWESSRTLDSLSYFLNFFEMNLKFRSKGDVTFYSLRNMPIFENGVFKQSVLYLRDITGDVLMDKMKKEAFLQIDKNMEQFAVLNDHIRNPLQVILGIVDLECPGAVEKIMPYVAEIDRTVNMLDNGWIESDKIRKMIAKHYGVSLVEESEFGEAISYLKKASRKKTV